MIVLPSLIVVAIAALIHASFQLSVSVLTLLGSHGIGRRTSQRKLVGLTNGFIAGAGIMTVLLLSLTGLLVTPFTHSVNNSMVWIICCGLLSGLGIAVWFFYYRKESGTTLWVPRSMARYLRARTKETRQTSEAFGLGMSSVIGELLFVSAPLLVSALVLAPLSATWQIVGVVLYGSISLLSLLIVGGLIGSGHSISRIQKWRETNKHFLQFSAGSALLILSFYLYVDRVVAVSMAATPGGF